MSKTADATRRADRIANGLCTKCGLSQAINGLMCQPCRNRQNDQNAKVRDTRRLNGLCHRCGEPAVKGLSRCIKHIRLKTTKRLSNRAFKLCDCGNKPKPGFKMCVNCSSRLLQRDHQTRLDVLTHYGCGQPKCAECDEKILAFLTIDHIEGGGNKHRRELGSGTRVYRWLKRHKYPSGYRVLCWNCNLRSFLNQIKSDSSNALCSRRIKLEVMNHYGAFCECCKNNDIDILTIDHINNDGYKDRKIVGTSVRLYRWLRRNNYPEEFRVLCANCNSGRVGTENKVCPHKLK